MAPTGAAPRSQSDHSDHSDHSDTASPGLRRARWEGQRLHVPMGHANCASSGWAAVWLRGGSAVVPIGARGHGFGASRRAQDGSAGAVLASRFSEKAPGAAVPAAVRARAAYLLGLRCRCRKASRQNAPLPSL